MVMCLDLSKKIAKSLKQMFGEHKKTLKPNKGSFHSIVANEVEDNKALAKLQIDLSSFLHIHQTND